MPKCPLCKSEMSETKWDNYTTYSLEGLPEKDRDYVISNKISYFSCNNTNQHRQNKLLEIHKHFIFINGKIYSFNGWGTNNTHWELLKNRGMKTFIFR